MPSQAIGIDIGTHAVKIAVLQKKGGVTRALRLYRAVLAGDTDPVRTQGALKRGGITGGPALLGITGRDLIIRYTHVPPVPDWRLKLLMQFEINEVSGQSGGEVAADYRRLSLPVETDEDTVLVALARNTWLHPRLEASRSAGLKAGGGCPNSVAVFNAFLAHGSYKEGETTFLVCLGRENIDMAIQRDGELLFARNMSGGGHVFTEAIMNTFGLKEPKAEKNKVTKGDLTPKGIARYPDSTTEKLANAMQGPAGQLVSMIQSSVMICRAQTKISDLNVDKLVLTGGTARMKGIVEYFKANMSVPVQLFDPVSELDLGGLDGADQEELGSTPADFVVAVGLAESMLQPTSFKLEVLTEKEKKKRHFLERSIWSLAAAVAALLLVVLMFKTESDAIAKVRTANARLEEIANDRKAIKDVQDQAVEKELDARRKEVALRVRRIAGAFTREVLAAVYANHTSKYIYLEAVKLTPEKQSFDLNAEPGETRATGGAAEEVKHNIHDQQVWPKLEVWGRLKDDTPDVGGTMLSYYRSLRAKLGGIKFEEPRKAPEGEYRWAVDLNTTQPDRENRFRMTFVPVLVPPKGES